MTDSAMQFTMRRMREAFLSPRALVLIGAVSLVLGVSGPFQTFDLLAPVPRIVYWAAICFLTFFMGAFGSTFVATWLELAGYSKIWLFLGAGFAAAIPVVPVILFVNVLTFENYDVDGATLVTTFFYALLISFVVTGMIEIFQRQPQSDVPTESANTNPLPKIIQRLNIANRGALVSLVVQDHYVEVTTGNGKELLLMRLSDAIEETVGVKGLQIHRSHWVALDQIVGTQRTNGRVMVQTRAGDQLPVSRSFLPAARSVGLLN